HELLADATDLPEHCPGQCDARQFHACRKQKLKRILLLTGALRFPHFRLQQLAYAGSELHGEQGCCQIINIHVDDQMPADLIAPILSPVGPRKIPIPELAGLPEAALSIDVKIDGGVGYDRYVDSDQPG